MARNETGVDFAGNEVRLLECADEKGRVGAQARDLRLFQREETVMVPGSLLEYSKRKRVASKEPGIRRSRLANIGKQIRTKQPR